jgi:hypothetical protein
VLSVPDQAWIAFGAIVAATIAGFFSYVNLVASKESKLSEFRQEWINALRSEVAILLSRLRALADLASSLEHRGKSPEKQSDSEFTHQAELYRELQEAYNSIYLRINPNEKSEKAKKINKEFLDAIYEARETYNASEMVDLGYIIEQAVEKSNTLLKYEWDRVRCGENAYRNAKRLAFALLLGSLAIALASGYFLVYKPRTEDSPNKTIQPTSAPLRSTPAADG